MAWSSTLYSGCDARFTTPQAQTSLLVSYGDWIAPGEYRFHSRFRRAINFIGVDTMVSIVDESVGAGPLNLVVDNLDAWSGERLVVQSDFLELNDVRIATDPAAKYNSAIEISTAIFSGQLPANLACFKDMLQDLASPQSLTFLLDKNDRFSGSTFNDAFQNRFATASRRISEGRFAAGVSEIKGLGCGLTPSGDDFIAGLLIALHVRQQVFSESTSALITNISAATRTTNPFSQALLNCAAQGRVFDRFKRVVLSLFAANSMQIETCTVDLLRIGATSGADMAVGLIFGLESNLEAQAA
jgi:hypothetical protein